MMGERSAAPACRAYGFICRLRLCGFARARVIMGRRAVTRCLMDGSYFERRWAKFFLPVYEKDRVFMLQCGDPPTIGYLDDDDW